MVRADRTEKNRVRENQKVTRRVAHQERRVQKDEDRRGETEKNRGRVTKERDDQKATT